MARPKANVHIDQVEAKLKMAEKGREQIYIPPDQEFAYFIGRLYGLQEAACLLYFWKPACAKNKINDIIKRMQDRLNGGTHKVNDPHA